MSCGLLPGVAFGPDVGPQVGSGDGAYIDLSAVRQRGPLTTGPDDLARNAGCQFDALSKSGAGNASAGSNLIEIITRRFRRLRHFRASVKVLDEAKQLGDLSSHTLDIVRWLSENVKRIARRYSMAA